MTEFVNKGSERRVWPGIQREDGRTLELDPGESAELDLPPRFKDPYLQPRAGRGAKAKHERPTETKSEEQPK